MHKKYSLDLYSSQKKKKTEMDCAKCTLKKKKKKVLCEV
jgi:hypothetical protein